jgi:hypothetical protein
MEWLNSPKIVAGVHCLKLRTKSMYVNFVVDPDGPASYDDQYDTAAYWCGNTQTGFGPDGQPVRPDVCRSGRGCCKF